MEGTYLIKGLILGKLVWLKQPGNGFRSLQIYPILMVKNVEISQSEMEGQPPSIVGGRPKSKGENVEKESERVTIIHFKTP